MPASKKSLKDDLSTKLDEVVSAIRDNKTCHCPPRSSGGGAVYGLGIIGAAFYYFQHMPVAKELPLTILKVILWPAFVAYRLIERFGL